MTYPSQFSRLNRPDFKTRYSEHIKAFTQALIKSNFGEHVFNTHRTNTETNLAILHMLATKRPQLNTTEQYDI